MKSPIIGYGSGNFFSAIATVYKECASHNMYILLLVEEGLVGLLIFGCGLFGIFKQLYKKQLFVGYVVQFIINLYLLLEIIFILLYNIIK